MDGVLFLIFFSTLFIYNNHRLLGLTDINPKRFKSLTDSFLSSSYSIINDKRFYKAGVCLSLAGIMVSLFFCPLRILFLLIPMGIVSFAYSFPLIRRKSGMLRLREIPGMKIFFVSLVWAMTTVLLPIINLKISLFNWQVLLVLCRRILFIFAITIPFDIRDRQADSLNKMKTIPILFGERKAKLLALLALSCFLILALFQYGMKECYNFFFAFSISTLISAVLIWQSSASKKPYYYLVLLDGTMILQFLLVWLFNGEL